MSFQAQPASPRSPKQRSALANGSRPFLVTVPGSTEAARHYKSVLDEVEAERGGKAAMSVTAREAARAYAGLAVELAKLHAAMAGGQNVDAEALGQIGDRMDRQARRMGPPKAPERPGVRERYARRPA
ncbi:NAD(P)/FAD-dependent oxidoreductase [Methylobacterium sp. J-030]|uniref:NAD(P)/FAD-dependent oxidoreductase n=1 Tax=Methylobacterium sp. J-030 TaxID=2836627 RepID=UPI001FBBEBEB|nr:NAD(P)/FAD-dependent oxidoreductase [Methylobacterium sp. J-030]MCJ2067911.1 NAD(P)/FAD-dependent oxidoreductase [Methylobacterium sp. J-030]